MLLPLVTYLGMDVLSIFDPSFFGVTIHTRLDTRQEIFVTFAVSTPLLQITTPTSWRGRCTMATTVIDDHVDFWAYVLTY